MFAVHRSYSLSSPRSLSHMYIHIGWSSSKNYVSSRVSNCYKTYILTHATHNVFSINLFVLRFSLFGFISNKYIRNFRIWVFCISFVHFIRFIVLRAIRLRWIFWAYFYDKVSFFCCPFITVFKWKFHRIYAYECRYKGRRNGELFTKQWPFPIPVM